MMYIIYDENKNTQKAKGRKVFKEQYLLRFIVYTLNMQI